jgi:hypothetical protein
MRTHVFGWVILGLAVFAPPWDTREQPRPVASGPGSAAFVAGAPDMRHAARVSTAVPTAVSTAMISGAVVGPEVADAAASRAGVDRASAPPQRAREPVTSAARPFLTHQGFAVREFAPGSSAHSEAIAGNIASGEFQDMVTPLARLYLAYFGRVPDYEGFDYYIGERDRGEPLEAIADEFAGSPEFNARYGSLDDAAFVDLVHRNIFGFPPGAEQRAYWVDQLASGRLTRGQLMLINSESPGYVAMTANQVFVAIAYAEALGRAPDAAELARWVRFLEGGNPTRAVIDALIADRGKG